MRIVPIRVWGAPSTVIHDNQSLAWPETPGPTYEKMRNESRPVREPQSFTLDNILASSRIIIIEGISGSGKDTFQKYLKSKLRNRVVHDYSEGELLWSWKHQQIQDIFKMQIRLMRQFLKYVETTLQRDDKAMFLLNRFHLSTYTTYMNGINSNATIEREYNLVIKALRALPAHIFLLQLMEAEMEARSSHPERGIAWRRFQQHIFEREGFGNFVKRNATLQKSMIKTAVRQNIPFSLLRLPSVPSLGIADKPTISTEGTANRDRSLDSSNSKLNPRTEASQKAI